ncbi:MAG: hypothetical protein CV088_13005 [Nitrospira sp. LK70]|nr:hypothetical protein [Nitrospira sp. LK70]
MTQVMIFLGLLTLAAYPGEVQAWPHYNGDKHQGQFREPDSCELPLNSCYRQRGIEGRYWTVGGENDPLPTTLMDQLQMEGMAGEHVGPGSGGNSGGYGEGYAGGYTEGYGYDEGYGGGYSDGYVEGYGGGSSRGAGRGSRAGYDSEITQSPNSDAVIRLGLPGVGR